MHIASHLETVIPPTRGAGTTAWAVVAAWRLQAARGVALFLGVFSLLNILGDWGRGGFDANLWWIDLHPLPLWAARLVLLAAAWCLLAFGAAPYPSPTRRRVTRGLLWGLLVMAVANAAHYYILLATGVLNAGPRVPFSLLVAGALWLVLCETPPREPTATPAPRGVLLLTVCACLIGFPLAQMNCYGRTDYRRPADAIVVFGARAYADGSCSQALRDRTDTAARLYQQGYAPLLIFSGGPGDGAIYEAQAMRAEALRLGVPADAIVMDYHGLDTRATVQDTVPIFQHYGVVHVIAVSHFYHLPRVKLAYQRAGWTVFTVPAEEPCPLYGIHALMAREVVALWVYYLRG